MIINGDIIIQECSHTLPHEAHSWFEWQGVFRWYTKHTCQGMTPEQFDLWMERKWPKPKPQHKHNFQYKPSQKHLWVNPDRYVWVCKDQKCDVIISSEKEEFRGALLHKGTTHLVRLPSRRRSWRSN